MTSDEFDFKLHVENLINKESYKPCEPVKEYYINTQFIKEINIPQISLESPKIHVHCKITDDFSAMQQYSHDEESVPPKVVCWNDLSVLDSKTATKTVRAGLKHQYKCLTDKLTFTFDTVSHGNKDLIPENTEDTQLIYHVIDPTMTQKSNAATVPSSRLIMSRSGSQIYSLTDPSQISTPHTSYSPIQEDPQSLRFATGQVPDGTIFIFDCGFADDALKVITESGRDLIVLAATQDTLNYYPQLPCDLFTSCLLTPSKVAILWEIQNNADIRTGLLSDIDIMYLIDIFNEHNITSDLLEMLDKALEAYVDEIASEVLESNPHLFQKVFRQSSFLAHLFTNFIFSHKMMKTISAVPTSFPSLPDMSTHELWDSFFFQVDRALYSLKESMKPTPRNIFAYNDLLDEQMKHLENWLLFPKSDRPQPLELPFIEILIVSPAFFQRAVHFCAKYLEISDSSTKSLMHTRTFPILPTMLDSEILAEADDETIADFTFVIINCLLLRTSLISLFGDHIDFWLKHVNSEVIKLAIYSLSMLLMFTRNKKAAEKLNTPEFVELLNNKFTKNEKSSLVRTISHIILGQLGYGVRQPLELMKDEINPMARAAIVSRVIATLDKEQSPEVREELIYDLTALMSDPYNRVREESLVALSHALSSYPQNFYDELKEYIATFNDDNIANSITKLLGQSFNILMYEPSTRVSQRIEEFLCFLSGRFDRVNTSILESNFVSGLMNRIAHPPAKKQSVSLSYTVNQMVVDEVPLVGSPSVSPTGLLACPDIIGRLHVQVPAFGVPARQVFNFFKNSMKPDHIPDDFKKIYTRRMQNKQTVEFQTFIDDFRLLSVSNRSQVCVVNTQNQFDAESSFWLNEPDTQSSVVVDYMHKNSQLIYSSGGISQKVRLYDISTLRAIQDMRIPKKQIYGMQWLKPYSSLFYVAQDDLIIYDTRLQKSVATIEGSGSQFLSANSCTAMPLYILESTKNGHIGMVDMRMMKTVAKAEVGSNIKKFDVHRQLPYGVALTNSLTGISFENGSILTFKQTLDVTPEAYCLHLSENLCSVRSGNIIKSFTIMY